MLLQAHLESEISDVGYMDEGTGGQDEGDGEHQIQSDLQPRSVEEPGADQHDRGGAG
jgi:hypothetical protein